jgi:hypothetical protein
MADHREHPIPCCGGLAFHADWCANYVNYNARRPCAIAACSAVATESIIVPGVAGKDAEQFVCRRHADEAEEDADGFPIYRKPISTTKPRPSSQPAAQLAPGQYHPDPEIDADVRAECSAAEAFDRSIGLGRSPFGQRTCSVCGIANHDMRKNCRGCKAVLPEPVAQGDTAEAANPNISVQDDGGTYEFWAGDGVGEPVGRIIGNRFVPDRIRTAPNTEAALVERMDALSKDAVEMKLCAVAWGPRARLLGNLTAAQVANIADAVPALCSALRRVEAVAAGWERAADGIPRDRNGVARLAEIELRSRAAEVRSALNGEVIKP